MRASIRDNETLFKAAAIGMIYPCAIPALSVRCRAVDAAPRSLQFRAAYVCWIHHHWQQTTEYAALLTPVIV